MDNQQSNTISEDSSLPQHYAASAASSSYIHGDGSGNPGSNNKINSDNINYEYNYCNHGDTSAPQNYDEILQCLYTSRYESHRGRVREPIEGTCIWVTEHPKYKGWLDKKTSSLLWLSADPGCGKSVTASFLVSHLKTQTDAIVCYFFFKDDNQEQRSAEFALCAILHQLFVRKRNLSKYAEEEFKAKGNKFTEEVETLWNILVKAVAEEGCGDIICVVDALDECEEVTLAPLIRHVTRLPGSHTSGIPLKFVVTSRPYLKIEKELVSRATTIRLRGEDEVNSITTDVTRVIENGIKELEAFWENPGGFGYLRNLLNLSADRTFLWVSLVLEILKNSEDCSRKEFTNIVSTIPSDLEEFYTKILDRSASPDKARRILHMVVEAPRPLTLDEMNTALTIRHNHKSLKDIQGDLYPGFGKAVKNLCGLFVRIIESKIYLVHQTAREFLIKGSSPGQGNWQFSLCPRNSNFIWADICISYLSLQEFGNDPRAVSACGLSEPEGEIPDDAPIYAFLDYAARNWVDHFRDSQDRQMELFEFTRLICEPGSRRFLTWFQVYLDSNQEQPAAPKDFTHLMVASWLGQRAVVERLLKEGGDINARSEEYGTALNIAARRKNKDIARILIKKNANAYIDGKEYSILHVKGLMLSDWCATNRVTLFIDAACK